MCVLSPREVSDARRRDGAVEAAAARTVMGAARAAKRSRISRHASTLSLRQKSGGPSYASEPFARCAGASGKSRVTLESGFGLPPPWTSLSSVSSSSVLLRRARNATTSCARAADDDDDDTSQVERTVRPIILWWAPEEIWLAAI